MISVLIKTQHKSAILTYLQIFGGLQLTSADPLTSPSGSEAAFCPISRVTNLVLNAIQMVSVATASVKNTKSPASVQATDWQLCLSQMSLSGVGGSGYATGACTPLPRILFQATRSAV